VPSSAQSRLASLLASSGIDVVTQTDRDFSLETLANHSAVVLENVPADEVGVDGMQTLASWITESGGALLLSGGKSSFQAGGYFKSPLDPVLPVSMEIRREHRKLDVAIVIALDRSGSMSMPAGGGTRTKLDLANLSAVQVLDLLSPNDELGVVAVDSEAHIIADLDPIRGRDDLRDKILGVGSGGGGIYVYEALSTAAKMLLTAKAQTRHIILFSDAADSEEPGAYRELLAQCAKANITVTVIGLGKQNDVDADLLRDVAKRGNGRIFFTENANDLPRLFAQDTFIVSRAAFVDEPTPVRTTAALFSLTGRPFEGMPAIGGFNLTYLRDGASPAVLTADDHSAPIVAAWQAGAGRVMTYTGELDGALTGAIGSWRPVGDYYASLVRWTAGARPALPSDMLVTQQVENGVARISLQLDPERTTTPIGRLPRVTTLSGTTGGGTPSIARAEMTWRTPDELVVEVPLTGSSTYLSTVDVPNVGRVTLPPVTLPYSPELAPASAGEGRTVLERLARATGGVERITAADVWKDLPRRQRSVPLRMWLTLTAVVLLVFEVLERRMRVLGGVNVALGARASRPQRRRRPAPAPVPVPEPAPPDAAQVAGETPALREDDPLGNALDEAAKRARRRV
ncbi:MAG TPA: VWA domain-containing protein, partial [Thermoanaerobaculia bacterium]|nr:VWA domain-containing protein [Thermoanaerobaculia bacterium]